MTNREPTPADVVLEPSAGTGHLAILAELAGTSLTLNEVSESRAGVLGQIFPAVSTTRFDAAHINDQLDARIVPSRTSRIQVRFSDFSARKCLISLP